MKVLGIVGVGLVGLLVAKMLLGGGHGPGRHFGGGGTASPTGVGGPGDAAAASRSVEVTARDALAFEPAAISVSEGETVTFVVTNAGKTPHEFTLGDTAMQEQHAQAMAHIPAGVSHTFPNSITLRPGETKELTWRFGDAALEYACHLQGHYESGMRGQITIT